MQPKYNPNNKSNNLIQRNQELKRKSRHRLIGSIVLLFIALAILMNVTSNVKPIAISPNVIEIKNTAASAPLAANPSDSSAPIATNASQPVVGESQQTSEPIAAESPVAATTGTGFRAAVVTKTNKNGTVQVKAPEPPAAVKETTPVTTAPKEATTAVAKPAAKPKINPAAILDDVGDTSNEPITTIDTSKKKTTTGGKAYIQFAALSSQDKASQLQQELASHGVHATVQTIQTEKGTLYRLRAGPFSREDAQSKLQQISASGYSGIVTGN